MSYSSAKLILPTFICTSHTYVNLYKYKLWPIKCSWIYKRHCLHHKLHASQSESLLKSQLVFLFLKTLNLHNLDGFALIGSGYLFQSKKVLTAHKKVSNPTSVFQPGVFMNCNIFSKRATSLNRQAKLMNWTSLFGKLLDGQTSPAKLSSQPVNLPSVQPFMKTVHSTIVGCHQCWTLFKYFYVRETLGNDVVANQVFLQRSTVVRLHICRLGQCWAVEYIFNQFPPTSNSFWSCKYNLTWDRRKDGAFCFSWNTHFTAKQWKRSIS